MTPREENELICKKLLEWKLHSGLGFIENDHGHNRWLLVPTFKNWEEAGLILDAFANKGFQLSLYFKHGTWECVLDRLSPPLCQQGDSAPEVIRRLAVLYLNAKLGYANQA